MIWCLTTLAGAAEVSWMPDALEGAASIRYAGGLERGGLVEGDARISGRRAHEHRVTVGAEFAPIRGVALNLGVATVPSWGLHFPGARSMLLEPVEGGGSYTFAPDQPDNDPGVRGAGMEGVWLGVALSPFSEAFANNHKATWRFDARFRTGAGQNRWTVHEDGKRGGGPGGTAFLLAGAFSRRAGPADGYVRGSWQREGAVDVDVVDEAGNAWVTGLKVRPASRVELLGGTEVVGGEEGDVRAAFDVFVGVGYRSWEDIPSGILLPDVIDASRTIAVTHSESLDGFAGMGVHLRFRHNVRVSLGGRFAYVLPHTQEHVFDVQTTPDSFGVGWNAGITGVLGKDDITGQPADAGLR